jgi:Ni,Fe-hydrogenase III large subunit
VSNVVISSMAVVRNGGTVAREAVPVLSERGLRVALTAAVAERLRVVAMFGAEEEGGVMVYVVLADDREAVLRVGRVKVEGVWESLTPVCGQVHLFERELAEQCGVKVVGHPWMKPVRFAAPIVGTCGEAAKQGVPEIGVMDFYRVEGEEVHEVAVGPVHAGIIEPGHFRFQCHGEEVFHLEISLGYQHRGVERALMGGPNGRSLHYAETLAGDTTVGHATAYCQILEALGGAHTPARGQALRGVGLELERLANHVGDMGALAGDTGFLPTMSFCGRIRGDFLNMTAVLCGSRFGRGLVKAGGVRFDPSQEEVEDLLKRLSQAEKDCVTAIDLLWDSPSVMARFEETGKVPTEVAEELGLVGPAARASGLARDARVDQPAGIYQFQQIPISTADTCDVFGRAYVRWLEVQRSLTFLKEQLEGLPGGAVCGEVGKLAGGELAVALVEGWRGELCHVALTDENGKFARYKVVDPSFHNWMGLAYALRNGQISDFPLCNKSFNLSYCGHDL